MFLENLDEDTVYEVLVSTRDAGGSFNIKPFGVRVKGNNIVLRLYPNHTLINVRKDRKFVLHFTDDVLLFTKAAFGLLDESSLSSMDCSVNCEVSDFFPDSVEDDYGENITTTIIAKPCKIIKNKQTPSTINRPTNKIIELLVDCSRYNYMDVHERDDFIKKIISTEKFIEKNAGKKHAESIKIIKKELKVNLHD